MKKNEVVFKSKSQAPMPYRVYYIGKDGIKVSGTPLDGKFPWKASQSIARRILRAWAGDLVVRYDTAQIGAFLKQWGKDWSGTNDISGGDTSATKPSALKRLIGWLRDQVLNRKVYFRQHYNKRDTSIMYHLSQEMVEAISYNLEKIIKKPLTEWNFSNEPTTKQEGSTICDWLFKRR